MPPGKSVLRVRLVQLSHTDHEYVMCTHAACGVAHTDASDPSDRGLLIFELVEGDHGAANTTLIVEDLVLVAVTDLRQPLACGHAGK